MITAFEKSAMNSVINSVIKKVQPFLKPAFEDNHVTWKFNQPLVSHKNMKLIHGINRVLTQCYRLTRRIQTLAIWKIILGLAVIILAIGFAFPESTVIPVQGATSQDWNHRSFWFEPWGKSGVHKGIDIFANNGTPLCATTDGIVMFQGRLSLGGNVIAVLGPKWRIHYYAHLSSINVSFGTAVAKGEVIGAVGDTGNAAGKPPHLHYAVITLIPYPWRWDNSTQGWKKMFFLDPGRILTATQKF
jgi:murein DD-endopeptidase MepM/ murein hydrolase activator NlpD